MIKTLLFATVLGLCVSTNALAQCGTSGGCGSGGCGSGGGYYMGGGGCGSGGCGSGGGGYYMGGGRYMGEVHMMDNSYGGNTYGAASAPFQVINVPGGERTRGYIYANVFGVRRLIPVINGQLPAISQNGGTLVLDYSHQYAYTTIYKTGVSYIAGTTVANKANGPSAVKNYGQEAAKVPAQTKDGPSALKHPDSLPQKAVGTSELPTTERGVSRPSDAEIEELLVK